MTDLAPDEQMKRFGTAQVEPEARLLRAGLLTALFDNGALRRICYAGHEVLRGIAYLPRDQNWGTYPPFIADLQVRQSKAGFAISFTARFADAAQSLLATAQIEATGDGNLRFSVTATPGADFVTNRTGFVILHPLAGVVGKPVAVTHTDGTLQKAKFPDLISPGQPIFEISGLTHQVMPGVTATLRMAGNKFEMEDHRNWMDASFKTYVCSLLDPWPYILPKGEAFTQTITLAITGKPRSASVQKPSPITVTLGKPGGRLPAFATAIGMADAASALAAVDLIAAAKPARLVCQIDGREQAQAEAAALYREIKAQTGIPVTLEIILPAAAPAAAEMAAIAERIRSARLTPDAVIVTQCHDLKSFQPGAPRPSGPGYGDMAEAARASFPGLPIGGGMLSFFTELNRKPPPAGLFDFITHSTCPIVHAADDLSVMETLEALPWIIKSTRAMIGKSPYHLGPSSIAGRDNPYGATSFANPGNQRLCLTDNDPRQRGLFGAAWTFGLAAAMARGRLDAVTLAAATGPRGLILSGGQVAPAYHVLAGLAGFSGARMVGTSCDAPNAVATLAHMSAAGPVVWLANLTPQPQKLQLVGMAGTWTRHSLDSGSFAMAAAPDYLKTPGILTKLGETGRAPQKLVLPPYAVVRLAQ